VSLEVDVEQGILESHRVVVAPLSEGTLRHELEGLQCLGSEAGNVLAFDIETSDDALKEESHLAAMAASAQSSTG
jgi:hypothetical protein